MSELSPIMELIGGVSLEVPIMLVVFIERRWVGFLRDGIVCTHHTDVIKIRDKKDI